MRLIRFTIVFSSFAEVLIYSMNISIRIFILNSFSKNIDILLLTDDALYILSSSHSSSKILIILLLLIIIYKTRFFSV